MESLGQELRKQRELRQISLREVSDATKINLRFLEAIERNEFTHLPGGQFNKGFIRAYSRHIGIDPERMVEAYTQELRRQGNDQPQAEEPFAVPVSPLRRKPALLALAIVALAGILLVLAAWLSFRYLFSSSATPPGNDPAVTGGEAGPARSGGGE